MKTIGLLKALALTHQADKMDKQNRLALQQCRLRELITYARENSPLSEYPTTNKADMAKHFDEWFTDRSITRKTVNHFMTDLSNVGKKLNGKYLVYTTSGSTGTPCVVLYDDTTINVSSAIGVLRSFARKVKA